MRATGNEKTRDIINVIIGVACLVLSFIISKVLSHAVGMLEYISIVVTFILMILGFHYFGKSFDYHWRCFQVKHRREIYKKENRKKTTK